jgi:pantothenate kinase
MAFVTMNDMHTNASFPTKVDVTDLVVDISGFSQQWKDDVTRLAQQITDSYRASGKERYVVAIGGASGSSKSTTAKVLEILVRHADVPAISVGQDGYHFRQDYLLHTCDSGGRLLAEHKGRHDTFDVLAIKSDLERFSNGEKVAFPTYSRKIHDPLANAIHVEERALLIFEGLWLLYDAAPWNELLPFYDMTIFFNAAPETRKSNTIARHVQGNEHSTSEAERFYTESDAVNAELVLRNVAKHDIDFFLSEG